MYIVLLHLDSIMTDSNSTHITETSREAFCRLVNQRIEKVTKSLELIKIIFKEIRLF